MTTYYAGDIYGALQIVRRHDDRGKFVVDCECGNRRVVSSITLKHNVGYCTCHRAGMGYKGKICIPQQGAGPAGGVLEQYNTRSNGAVTSTPPRDVADVTSGAGCILAPLI